MAQRDSSLSSFQGRTALTAQITLSGSGLPEHSLGTDSVTLTGIPEAGKTVLWG